MWQCKTVTAVFYFPLQFVSIFRIRPAVSCLLFQWSAPSRRWSWSWRESYATHSTPWIIHYSVILHISYSTYTTTIRMWQRALFLAWCESFCSPRNARPASSLYKCKHVTHSWAHLSELCSLEKLRGILECALQSRKTPEHTWVSILECALLSSTRLNQQYAAVWHSHRCDFIGN